jgi:hypothetical protein
MVGTNAAPGLISPDEQAVFVAKGNRAVEGGVVSEENVLGVGHRYRIAVETREASIFASYF